MSFFKCKVCEQKDLRIQDLQAQIKFLQNLLAPNRGAGIINQEANKLLEGGSLPAIELGPMSNEDEDKRWSEVERESTRILTGGYAEHE